MSSSAIRRARPRLREPSPSTPTKLNHVRFYRVGNLVERNSGDFLKYQVARMNNTSPEEAQREIDLYKAARDEQLTKLRRLIEARMHVQKEDARHILGLPKPFFETIWSYSKVIRRMVEREGKKKVRFKKKRKARDF